MVGDKSRTEITETIRGAVKQAGALLTAVAAIASLALGLAAGALYMAYRALRLAAA